MNLLMQIRRFLIFGVGGIGLLVSIIVALANKEELKKDNDIIIFLVLLFLASLVTLLYRFSRANVFTITLLIFIAAPLVITLTLLMLIILITSGSSHYLVVYFPFYSIPLYCLIYIYLLSAKEKQFLQQIKVALGYHSAFFGTISLIVGMYFFAKIGTIPDVTVNITKGEFINFRFLAALLSFPFLATSLWGRAIVDHKLL
ncbi:hypothetical protein [Paenibacillus lupini]|uniref:hypothetical protein n=1 Tax=Paenibacillus lupini TaxID=1450204 RepID=UPI0014249887|nr:hypothetical protein [Paenibacillus lupini]NIK24222.1 membrane-associated HD superfamily phosphohydrolase [Paenibacillus lupini]